MPSIRAICRGNHSRNGRRAMPDSEPQNEIPNSNGSTQPEAPRRTLREVAEAAWDEVVEDAPDDDEESPIEEPVDEGGQPRDKMGRFVAKEPSEPGEADGEEPTQPRPEITAPQPPEGTTQPAQAESSEAPANWSAEHRQLFDRQPPEVKAFILERHQSMEGDYQRRVQATVPATQFVQSVAPVFNDPTVAASLQHFGLSPSQAVQEWGAVHKRMFGPDMRDRYLLLSQLAQQMGISLNPAAASQSNQPVGQRPPGLTQEELANPAIHWFADNVSQTSNAVAQLTNRLQQMEQAAAGREYAEAFQRVQWGINQLADEKGPDGQRLRPYFDDPEVAQVMTDLLRANPGRDVAQTYEQVQYMIPRIRAAISAAETAKAQAKKDAGRAAQAARSNIRGRTSPVTGPNAANGQARTLRETLEATADEIGLE